MSSGSSGSRDTWSSSTSLRAFLSINFILTDYEGSISVSQVIVAARNALVLL
jgi:hypothetical protein